MPVIPLPCEEIVLRAVLRKSWIDPETKRITATAFMRDPKKDEDGLSVNIRSTTDLHAWLGGFNKSFGADSLHTGTIRDVDAHLDVSQTDEGTAEDPSHAVITGLPFGDDDPKRAESLASRLRDMSRIADRQLRQK